MACCAGGMAPVNGWSPPEPGCWVFTVSDSGPCSDVAVVVFSGVAVPWVDWLDVAVPLSRQRRVVLVEREGMEGPGLEASARVPSRSSLIDEVNAVVELLDMLGVERAIVVAHSMGAFIGEAFARLFPQRCARLVFVDASCELEPAGVGASLGRSLKHLLTGTAARWSHWVWVRRLHAAVLWWPRRAGLRHAPPGCEAPYLRRFFSDEGFIRTLWAEYEAYSLWAEELRGLARRHPLRTELRVLVASRHRLLPDPWVARQRRRFMLYDAEIRHHTTMEQQPIAGRDTLAIQNSIEVVYGSHLLMREHPQLVACLAAEP